MNDPELRELRNKIGLGLGICILLLVPLFLFFYNKISQDDTSIVKSIKNEETFYLLIITKNDSNQYKNILRNSRVDYKVMNLDIYRQSKSVYQTLEIPISDVKTPAVLYIEEVKLVSTLNEITEESLQEFLENYEERRTIE